MNSLFERASAGDAHATRMVVDSLRPRLAKMAAYYARRTGEEADDLLQEAWLGLLEALPGLDVRIGSPEQYLIHHARWRLLDAVRRASTRRFASLDDSALEIEAREESPAGYACVAEFSRRLKPVQRQVLSLLVDGFTWREAGGTLGCTSANIAYHVRQIRRCYEEWLGEAGPDAPCISQPKRR
ncbi:MAG TPA: sigma-70 family RNA polymerase sigma factor [Armatimonadota bacterium]|nr:sigma-70 family RNA polymerase sigma factor [Armatimonadota bacterium]HPT97086.1 sigma-70 family RNA polymerase sigma factor [Armatimonadota bacterium]